MQIQGTAGLNVGPQGNTQDVADNPQTGSFRGEQVTVRSAKSSLADAAEEMTFHFSEKVEEKTVGERDFRPESRLQVMRVEDINQYLQAAKAEQTPADLVALAKLMLASQQSPGQLARKASEDPTQQSLMLQFALHEGERTGTYADAMGAIRDALAELELESGPAIRAGLNSIDAAVSFGQTTESIQSFQNTYRDVALGSGTLVETLKLALERFGSTAFAKGLKSLLKALGADVAALRPSTQPTRLQAVIQDIYQLEVFNTLLDEADKLSSSLRERHGTAKFDNVEFMKQLVSITGDRWASPTRFQEIPGHFGITQILAEVQLIGQSLQILRDMPVKIFLDAETRRMVLDAGQEALDDVIEREEEQNDSEDEQSAGEGDEAAQGNKGVKGQGNVNPTPTKGS